MLAALTELTNLALRGCIPSCALSSFYGASLIALRKKDGGLRPIAIGSVFRRIAAKVAAAKVSARVGAELRPIQLGVGTRNGCEAAVHAVRAHINNASDFTDPTALVKLDVANAFNTLRRDAMLEATKAWIPEIYPLVLQAYNTATPLFMGNSKIMSSTGIQQGDPLSSLLFSISVDTVAKAIDADVNVWYLDDATFACPLNNVRTNICQIHDGLKKLGLEINSSKCEVVLLGHNKHIWQVQAMEDLKELLPGIHEVTPEEATLLGAPLHDAGVRTKMLSSEKSLQKTINRLQQLEEAHQAFFLLKNYLAVPKLLYLLRSTPTFNHPRLLQELTRLSVEESSTSLASLWTVTLGDRPPCQ